MFNVGGKKTSLNCKEDCRGSNNSQAHSLTNKSEVDI